MATKKSYGNFKKDSHSGYWRIQRGGGGILKLEKNLKNSKKNWREENSLKIVYTFHCLSPFSAPPPPRKNFWIRRKSGTKLESPAGSDSGLGFYFSVARAIPKSQGYKVFSRVKYETVKVAKLYFKGWLSQCKKRSKSQRNLDFITHSNVQKG